MCTDRQALKKRTTVPDIVKKKRGFDGECQIAWKFSFKKLCLFIYSFDCIVVANPFWFILRINIVHTVILTFLWQISYIPCLYIVYVTRLAIFVAKMSLIIVLVITVYTCSLLELLVYLMLCDIFYSDISVFGGFVWS